MKNSALEKTRSSRSTATSPLRSQTAKDKSRDEAQAPSAPLAAEELTRRLFDAFSRRDLETALALVHPDIVFQPVSAAVMNEGEPYTGHAGIRRYLADLETHWDELIVQPMQIRAAGHAVVVLGRASGRGPMGSFQDAPTTWVLKFREGLVARAQIFSDEQQARRSLAQQQDQR